tara:strand:- start:149 stop:1663 length:1515 start_codon:yes stop_codon:yes gene_type:complete
MTTNPIDTDPNTAEQELPPFKLETREVNSGKPWEGDDAGRENVAKALTNLVRVEKNPLVITVNGSWGTGKTYFLTRWQKHLAIDKLKAIYFNAWEDDYCNDPLIAIIGQLCENFTEKEYRTPLKLVVEAAQKVSTKFALKGLSALTCGFLNLTEDEIASTKNFINTISEVLAAAKSDDSKTARGRLFDEYQESRKSREELRKALSELTIEVRNKTGGPLVFIIDELDRCRPTFAIELLERIKHLFGIPNMIFVLGIDRNQLGSSVKSVYGNIDVDGYLRRFFDMEFSLPAVDAGVYCTALLQKHGVDEYGRTRGNAHVNSYRMVENLLPFLSEQLKLSLRDVESLVRAYVFTIRNVNTSHTLWPELTSILLVLRLKNHKLYSQYTQGKIGAKEVLDYIEDHYGNFGPDDYNPNFHNSCWISVTVYQCMPESYRNRPQVFEEMSRLKNKEVDPADCQYLSKRMVNMNLEQREHFLNKFFEARSQSVMSITPLKQSIEKLLGSIDL